MEKEQKAYYIFIFVLIVTGMLALGITIGSAIGYKDGQIDALTGTVKYELIDELDQTRTWQTIKR